jgi:hypothetical protein
MDEVFTAVLAVLLAALFSACGERCPVLRPASTAPRTGRSGSARIDAATGTTRFVNR